MVRSVDNDFSSFVEFIAAYNLGAVTADAKKRSSLRSAHKVYLSALHIWSRCNMMAEMQVFQLHARNVERDGHEMALFREAIADLGSSLLCALHGLYKQAQASLRSSIENFVRFTGGIFDANAISTTSVFDLFAYARATEMYAGDTNSLDRLHSIYGELCKFVHSATLEHMTGNHALETFPQYEEKKFHDWLATARAIVKAYYSALISANRLIYLRAHFRTQEVFDLVIPARQRTTLLGDGN